jgi:endonuclease-3 related protein
MSAPLSLLDIYASLDRMHAWRGWHWWPDADPFEVCVGAILVQNTMWTNVERALGRLRAAGALEPQVMAALSLPELEDLVRPSGQFRQKARKLRAFLDLAESAGGLDSLLSLDAPALRQRLLATWGIGPETADCIVCYAARQPALAVDAYTMRLFGRLGLGPRSTGYGEWQRWMLDALTREAGAAARPETLRDLFARYHALVVMHSKHLCVKRAPGCARCELSARCAFSIGSRADQARG